MIKGNSLHKENRMGRGKDILSLSR